MGWVVSVLRRAALTVALGFSGGGRRGPREKRFQRGVGGTFQSPIQIGIHRAAIHNCRLRRNRYFRKKGRKEGCMIIITSGCLCLQMSFSLFSFCNLVFYTGEGALNIFFVFF
ncbi:hypothetical protein CC78DRAFT_275293 [Lojkania enalia]|uniref:Secreted protein n=1 Tax=Lojkania enalia TaxID=147567 RepID=A0A9P4KC97_9PLEO|nr:hypothetical protein CC78DRAFT_275293 [Didymosphaeria enalia]